MRGSSCKRISRLELLQEAQVAALQVAYIVDAVPHHDEARETQAEGETAPLLGIDAAGAQHVGVHQAAGQQFHPAALLADRAAGAAANQALDIQFEARFDERKIARTKARYPATPPQR